MQATPPPYRMWMGRLRRGPKAAWPEVDTEQDAKLSKEKGDGRRGGGLRLADARKHPQRRISAAATAAIYAGQDAQEGRTTDDRVREREAAEQPARAEAAEARKTWAEAVQQRGYFFRRWQYAVKEAKRPQTGSEAIDAGRRLASGECHRGFPLEASVCDLLATARNSAACFQRNGSGCAAGST
jgi:hypothetical protein